LKEHLVLQEPLIAFGEALRLEHELDMPQVSLNLIGLSEELELESEFDVLQLASFVV
jgi:hypothetical protein